MKISLILLSLISFSVYGKTILFLGDSLTEGYQLEREEAYPAVVEKELKKTTKDIKVINGGVSGATSASGLKRMDWYLKAKPDILVLALGANDGLRGLKVEDTERNLSKVIEKAQERNIKVLLVGMKMPTNYGKTFRDKFEKIFPKLSKKYNIPLVPFILEGVGGVPKYNLPDGMHPNAEGHKIMSQLMIKYLRPEL